MKVAVLYSMLPKDLLDKVLGEGAVNWDRTPGQEVEVFLTRIKIPGP